VKTSDKEWFDLNYQRDGSPVTLRRKANYLANHLDRIKRSEPRFKESRWRSALASVNALKKACRFALARVRPHSPDGKLLTATHPLKKARGVTTRKNRRDVVGLAMRLTELVDVVVQGIKEGATPEFCELGAEMLRHAVRKSPYYKLTYQGRRQSPADWARELGIDRQVIRERLKLGWSVEDALSKPLTPHGRRNVKLLTYNGETRSMTEWARELGIKLVTLSHRLNAGWSVEDALTRPLQKRSK